ncbi:MAG: hypothetical protein KAU50_01980 [Candidatus Marinimicrobia bacterium]|nr:hypothetical protein [Candidatus Neomarinimicrobiota bacterium]
MKKLYPHINITLVLANLLLFVTGCATMKTLLHRDVEELFRGADAAGGGVMTAEECNGLPLPVRRYLEYSGVIGKARIQTVRLKQTGHFRTKADQPWFPIKAIQFIRPDDIGFVWLGKITPFPLFTISAKDKFLNGEGNMLVKLLSIKTIADAKGPEVDQGELLRYLSEAVWYPSAFLSANVEWEAVDEHSAKPRFNIMGIPLMEYSILTMKAG